MTVGFKGPDFFLLLLQIAVRCIYINCLYASIFANLLVKQCLPDTRHFTMAIDLEKPDRAQSTDPGSTRTRRSGV